MSTNLDASKLTFKSRGSVFFRNVVVNSVNIGLVQFLRVIAVLKQEVDGNFFAESLFQRVYGVSSRKILLDEVFQQNRYRKVKIGQSPLLKSQRKNIHQLQEKSRVQPHQKKHLTRKKPVLLQPHLSQMSLKNHNPHEEHQSDLKWKQKNPSQHIVILLEMSIKLTKSLSLTMSKVRRNFKRT